MAVKVRKEISQDVVRELLIHAPESRDMYRRVSCKGAKAGDRVGWVSSALGYVVCSFAGMKDVYVHRLVWTYHNGEIPEKMCIDHINGDRTDNRLANLRLTTRSENPKNCKSRRLEKILQAHGICPYTGRKVAA